MNRSWCFFSCCWPKMPRMVIHEMVIGELQFHCRRCDSFCLYTTPPQGARGQTAVPGNSLIWWTHISATPTTNTGFCCDVIRSSFTNQTILQPSWHQFMFIAMHWGGLYSMAKFRHPMSLEPNPSHRYLWPLRHLISVGLYGGSNARKCMMVLDFDDGT